MRTMKFHPQAAEALDLIAARSNSDIAALCTVYYGIYMCHGLRAGRLQFAVCSLSLLACGLKVVKVKVEQTHVSVYLLLCLFHLDRSLFAHELLHLKLE